MATSAPRFKNPWVDAEGFTDLGPYEFEGVHHDLYCFSSIPGILIHVGARYGEYSAYHSASIELNYRKGNPCLICRGYTGPVQEAVSRMIQRRMLTEKLYDANRELIYNPSTSLSVGSGSTPTAGYRHSL